MTSKTKLSFVVPDVPVAQPRQRQRVAPGGFVQNYTPTDSPVNAFKASVKRAANDAYRGKPLSGPLSVSVLFVFPRTSGQIWKTKPMPRIWHTKKPDLDNLVKAVWDALSGIVWIDDKQICDARQRKKIASGDEQPHCVVVIKELE